MSMRTYGILHPFNLDWRMVAPRDFDTLEYFITPTLSVLFKDIIATKGKGGAFRIGSYIMQDPTAHTRFLRDVLPQRSQERIETAYNNPDFSAFFTLEEGEGLRLLFEENGFICKNVLVNVNGNPIDLNALNQNDFRKVVDVFSDLHVLGMMHFQDVGDTLKNMQQIMEEAGYRRAMQDVEKKQANATPTKKKLWQTGGMAAACLAGSAVLVEVGRRMLKSGGWKGWLVGGLCSVVGIGLGLIGKKMGSEVVNYMKVGHIHG